MDWVDPISSEPAKEREGDMSSVATGFVMRMRKWATSAQGETTPGSEVSGNKRPKRSDPNEEAQKSPTIITVDSPKRASDVVSALEGAAQDTSKEACASLEDGAPIGGPPNADQAVSEAPSIETNVSPPLQARRFSLAIPDACKARLLDRLVLGSYVKPMKWGRPSTDTSAPSPDATREIIDC